MTLTQAISKANRFNIFERRVEDIKAGGKSFGDLSQNEKDIMDLAGLRKGILENQGGDKFKQWIRENVTGLTQVKKTRFTWDLAAKKMKEGGGELTEEMIEEINEAVRRGETLATS